MEQEIVINLNSLVTVHFYNESTGNTSSMKVYSNILQEAMNEFSSKWEVTTTDFN